MDMYQKINILDVKNNIEINRKLEFELQNLRDKYLYQCTFTNRPICNFTQDTKKNKLKNLFYKNNNKKLIKNMDTLNVNIVKVNKDAKLPVLGTPYSAAFDLFSVEDVILEKNKITVIDTGLKMEMPNDMCAKIMSRSSMSLKNITVEAGLIDNDYRGVIKVLLCNRGDDDYLVNKGDKIAQLKFEKYFTYYKFVEKEELEKTDRNDGGFGSTGR